MAKKKSQLHTMIVKKIDQIDPIDMAVMGGGAYLGYHGYTPITALVNSVLEIANVIPTVDFDLSNPADEAFAAEKLLGTMTWGIPGGFIIDMLFPTPSPPQQDFQQERPLKDKEDEQKRRLHAVLGAIECYAYTRPGFLKGVGEIIPL